MRSYSTLSTDTVRVAIQAASSPTTQTPWFAFTGPTSTTPTTWTAGTWEAAQLSTGEWAADCTIGPGGVTLGTGEWTVWIRLGTAGTGPVWPLTTIQIT